MLSNSFATWAYGVLKVEGLSEWVIQPGEPYCWLNQKVIMVNTEKRSTFLHEVAHALAPEPEQVGTFVSPRFTIFHYAFIRCGGTQYHGGRWADKFTKLVHKYLEEY